MKVSICGVDPGYTGGLSIFSEKDLEMPIVYKMPIIKEVQKTSGKTKIKQSYDLLEIKKIFDMHLNNNSIFYLEKVAPHYGEGSVSSFNFGKGYGNLEGLIVGLFNKMPIEVTPQAWKKHFPELITSEMVDIKVQMKELRLINKKTKETKAQIENKKQIDKLGRQFKFLAKTEARNLASKLYPSLSDNFVKKNSDGIAESLLIALFGKDKQNGLV